MTPETPANLTVVWPPSAHPNPILYRLQYRLKGANVWIDAAARGGPGTQLTVTGLVAGAVYEFRHTATNGPTWIEVSKPTEIKAGLPPTTPTLKVRPQ